MVELRFGASAGATWDRPQLVVASPGPARCGRPQAGPRVTRPHMSSISPRQDRTAALHPYLDPELSHAAQTALLGLAAGLDSGQLSYLFGLTNRKRRKSALTELIDRGCALVDADGEVRAVARGQRELLPPRDLQSVLKRQKVVKALEYLTSPLARLVAGGYAAMAAALTPEEAEQLERLVAHLEATLETDRARQRHRKRSVYSFIDRRVPSASLRAGGQGPSVAPPDVEERSADLLCGQLTNAKVREHREKTIGRIVAALTRRGEVALGHWWAIVVAVVARFSDPDEAWEECRLRLESFALRNRISLPKSLRIRGLDPRVLRARYPVPPCGYGPWVDAEQQLWGAFHRRYSPALGHGDCVKDLWIQAHEAARDELPVREGEIDPDAEAVYETRLYRHADRLVGLSAGALRSLSQGAHSRLHVEVLEMRQRMRQQEADREERQLLRKVLRYASDAPPGAEGEGHLTRRGIDDMGAAPRVITFDDLPGNWAPRLLRLALRRSLGRSISTAEWEHLRKSAEDAGRRRSRRRRHARLYELVLSRLQYGDRILVVPEKQRFPVASLVSLVSSALHEIEKKNATSEEVRRAVIAVTEHVLYRTTVDVVAEDGTYAGQTLGAAAILSGASGAVHDVVDRSGLGNALEAVGEHDLLRRLLGCGEPTVSPTLQRSVGRCRHGRLNPSGSRAGLGRAVVRPVACGGHAREHAIHRHGEKRHGYGSAGRDSRCVGPGGLRSRPRRRGRCDGTHP